MPMHRPVCGLAFVVFVTFTTAGFAQQPRSGTDERMDQFEKRLSELERKYQADIKVKDEEIARLKAQLQTQPPATRSAAKTSRDLIKEIDAPAASAPGAIRPPPGSPTIHRWGPSSFNPSLTVVSDFVGNISTLGENKARNRFDIRAVELDLRAAVHPKADGVLILPFVREMEDSLFFEPGMEQEGPENALEIEEAYLHIHDIGIPNLTAKLGRFHVRFGRQNLLHAHDWPTIDNNFVNQSFLGLEALSDSGLSLSYVIPPKLVADQYVELIAEIISGEGGESPTLNNDASVQSPAFNLHALWNRDLNRDWNFELGTSFLTGRHDNSSSLATHLFGFDITLMHTDPGGRFNNRLLQAEMIYGITETSSNEKQHAFGAYFLAQQQFKKDWYAGLRLDWTENALDDSQEVYGVSPYVTWFWSEFLRFRLEYQHKEGDVPDENALFFQAVWIFGAHPPHPYWAMQHH